MSSSRPRYFVCASLKLLVGLLAYVAQGFLLSKSQKRAATDLGSSTYVVATLLYCLATYILSLFSTRTDHCKCIHTEVMNV